MQAYDPTFAGKQIAGQADVGQNIGRGSQYAGHGGPDHPDGQRRPPAAEDNMPRQPANAPRNSCSTKPTLARSTKVVVRGTTAMMMVIRLCKGPDT